MFNSVFEILPNAIVLNDADTESVTEGVLWVHTTSSGALLRSRNNHDCSWLAIGLTQLFNSLLISN